LSLIHVRVATRTRWACGYVQALPLVLLSLVPLPHASPPDPLWLEGIYDGADFDDVVSTIVSATALVGILVVSAASVDIRRGPISPADAGPASPSHCSTFHTRAPPVRGPLSRLFLTH